MIIPPSTSRRQALPTWDSFVEDAMAEVSVQIVPLVSRGDVNEVPVMLNRAGLEVRQLAEVVGDREMGEAIDATTERTPGWWCWVTWPGFWGWWRAWKRCR